MDYSNDPTARRAEWFRYYSEKRITHQWFQVHLLKELPDVKSVLEIGPGLGLVSAMLHNAGFAVTTLDRLPPQYAHSEIQFIEAELTDLDAQRLLGVRLHPVLRNVGTSLLAGCRRHSREIP